MFDVDAGRVPGGVRLASWHRVLALPRLHVRRDLGGGAGHTARGPAHTSLPAQSDSRGLSLQGRAMGAALPRGPQEHELRGRHGKSQRTYTHNFAP